MSLERKMAVLGCRRMIGRHTYQEIAKVLQDVNEEYAIQNKIVATTTDNGSNFVKSFRVFGTELMANAESDNNENEDVEFVPLTSILDLNEEGEEVESIYSLNLVATSDSRSAESDPIYKRIMRGSLGRCQALWNKQGTCSQNADMIKNKLGIYLIKPNDTRWNSLYDALSCIDKLITEKNNDVNDVCDSVGLPRFREDDISFIKEYCKVMKPLANSLDKLQCEKKAYMGILLPVLHSLRRRLTSNEMGNLMICGPLLEALIKGLDKRFSSQWFRKDLVLASLTHPEYMYSWIKDAEKEEKARVWLHTAAKNLSSKLDEECATAEVESEDDLFDFGSKSSSVSWDQEVKQYLMFPLENLASLNTLPLMKKLFLKFNTSVPSSAAVERVFSVGGDVVTDKRARISDANFENSLQLKIGIK